MERLFVLNCGGISPFQTYNLSNCRYVTPLYNSIPRRGISSLFINNFQTFYVTTIPPRPG